MEFKKVIIVILISFCAGCSTAAGAKLVFPEKFGLVKIARHVFIESDASEADKIEIIEAFKEAEKLVQEVYGSIESSPSINVCITEECYESFGGMGSKAKIYGKYILLSPRGLDKHYLAHEWSHLELRKRLGLIAWYKLPQWFDEGLAVLVSDSPDHSEAHWNMLLDLDVARPSREELMEFISLRDWLDAVEEYGATQNVERRKNGAIEIRPVYTSAGHEVRLWFNRAQTNGLLHLISELKDGSRLSEVYR